MKRIITIFILLSIGFFSTQKVLGQTISADNIDTPTPSVSNVLQFKAIPGDKHNTLSWTNPLNPNYSGVVIQRSSDNFVTFFDAGQNIFKGSGNSCVDFDLTNGQTYFYTIFTYDTAGNYSSGAITKSKPNLPSLINPYQEGPREYFDTTQINKPVTSKKVDRIEFTNFYYYLVADKKPLEIGLDTQNNLCVTNNSIAIIEITSNIFAKPLNVITVSTDDTSYLMKLIPEKNKYQVVIPAPAVKGEHDLRLVAVFGDKSISDLKTKLLVDPQGYVFSMTSSFLGIGHRKEMRIDGAKITIYQKRDDAWEIWDAGEYFQTNPTTSNSQGEYAFFVPNGEYYLTVEKAGYKTTKTNSLKVENKILNINVEMKLKVEPWVWVIFLISVGAILFSLIRLFTRRRKKNQ